MTFTTDDLCMEYLDNFQILDSIKLNHPKFRMIAFTISNFREKEDLNKNLEFQKWFEDHKDWVEIAVHSYDHQYPPDGDRENERHWIELALNSLKQYLPEKYGYRSPGWQTTNKTVPILKDLGFSYIAYEDKIYYLKEKRSEDSIVNSHLYDVKSLKIMEEIYELSIL